MTMREARGTPSRTTIIRRLWLAADRQISESERRLARPDADAAAEREARTLATLGKLLHELVAIDVARRKAGTAGGASGRDGEDHDEPPRDLDQFREAIQSRLDRLVAAGADARGAGGTVEG
jgi:hypothetical protein